MTKGYAADDISRTAWEICLFDEKRNIAFTFELTAHSLQDHVKGTRMPTSSIPYNGEFMDAFRALAEAMTKMGLMNDSATTSELKATKYHLEDMRKLTFMGTKE
jgi:hypothetical protein